MTHDRSQPEPTARTPLGDGRAAGSGRFSDAHLTALLHAAAGADEAAGADAGAHRHEPGRAHAGARARGRRWVWASAGLVAAAMALAGGLSLLPIGASREPGRSNVAGGLATAPTAGATVANRVVPAGEEPLASSGVVLFAVAQDDSGGIECVRWNDQPLARGQRLADLSTTDLQLMGLRLTCAPAPARLLVVGLEGPAAMLPCSDERVRELAQCLLANDACSASAWNSGNCVRSGCAETGLHVRVETLAMR